MTGPGTEKSDSVPAALSKNEFVIRAKSAKRIGYDVLNHMNRTGEVPMRMRQAKRQPPGNGRLMLAIGGPAKRQPPGNGRLKLQFGGYATRDEQIKAQERRAMGEEPEKPAAPAAPATTGRTGSEMELAIREERRKDNPLKSIPRWFGYSKGGKSGLRSGYASGGKAHPGFKAVAAKIGKNPNIRNPGAVLAAASRRASPAAKRANPRLNRVK